MNILEIIRGDTTVYTVSFKDGSTAVNITGHTVFFTVKRRITDTDTNALISKTVTTHSNAAGGITQVALSPTETTVATGTHVYDLQLKDAAGNIFSSHQGTCKVLADVTRRS